MAYHGGLAEDVIRAGAAAVLPSRLNSSDVGQGLRMELRSLSLPTARSAPGGGNADGSDVHANQFLPIQEL